MCRFEAELFPNLHRTKSLSSVARRRQPTKPRLGLGHEMEASARSPQRQAMPVTGALTVLEQVVNRVPHRASRASVLTPGFGIAATLGYGGWRRSGCASAVPARVPGQRQCQCR